MGEYFWFEQPKLRNYNKTGSVNTIRDAIDTMTEEQKTAMYTLIGQTLDNEVRKALNSREAFINANKLRRKNMGPGSTIDLMDAFVYAMDTKGRYTKLGKIKNNSITWRHFEDVYDMRLEITGSCEPFKPTHLFKPTKIIQNGPAFIVFWNDGTKTVLKRKDGDQDDPYAAFGQALMIKMFGSNSAAHKIVDHCKEDQNGRDESV